MRQLILICVFAVTLTATLGWSDPARAIDPCCTVISFNAHSGLVTARERATGRVTKFQIAGFQPVDGIRLARVFKAGAALAVEPLEPPHGLRSRVGLWHTGLRARLIVAGFDPVDGVVGSMGGH